MEPLAPEVGPAAFTGARTRSTLARALRSGRTAHPYPSPRSARTKRRVRRSAVAAVASAVVGAVALAVPTQQAGADSSAPSSSVHGSRATSATHGDSRSEGPGSNNRGTLDTRSIPAVAPEPRGTPVSDGLPPTRVGAAGTATTEAEAATLASRVLHPGARLDENGPQGMNVEAAWSAYGNGSANVTIAYVEGGINWHLSDAATLASVAYVNWQQAPIPCSGASVPTATMIIGGVSQACHTAYSTSFADYDIDHDGRVNAAEWHNDPRVTDANANSVTDPEDLIAAFCGAGFSPPADTATGMHCDISGWDFYDNQNDPSMIDTAYTHANNQMDTLHAECPNCTIMPVKAGDESLDRTDNLAEAWIYATDAGARVIASVTADLGYSSFMSQAVSYCQSQGVAVVEATNDFDSTDHQGGMYWPYVIPGNGEVVNSAGNGWTRSDLTSWGTHSMFSVATGGGSTSESTPTTAGVLGLLLSYGDASFAGGHIPAKLNALQLEQVVRTSATVISDAATPGLSWATGTESADNWSTQYGYGMPNAAAAGALIAAGTIPPTAYISSPNWYAMIDPTTTANVPVTGSITTESPTDAFTWTLQASTGAQPTNAQWATVGTGLGTGSFSGTLGTFSTATVPAGFWGAGYSLSAPPGDKTIAASEQYAVTFRLLVTDTTASTSGEDRRAVNVVHDASLLSGFPINNGASMEGSPALVDLQGSGHLDIVVGDSNGAIHALDPVTGHELPGWPVHTNAVNTGTLALPHGTSPGDEPVVSSVAVGDLTHTGTLDVVAASTSGNTYAFSSSGTLLPGWPQAASTGIAAPAIPRPQQPNVRIGVMGSSAPPVLADLHGDHHLEILQSGWDGYLHVWDSTGANVAGWPVQVGQPPGFTPASGYTLEADHKLDTPPALAYFAGLSQPPSIVVRSQETEIKAPGVQPLPYGFVFAYSASGTPVPGWPVTLTGLLEYYGSAMEMITEGTDAPIAANTGGFGDQVAVNPVWTTPYLLNSNGTSAGNYGDMGAAANSLITVDGNPSLALTPASLPPDVPIPFTESGAFGQVGAPGSGLDYTDSSVGSATFAGAELQVDAGLGISQYMTAFPANQAGASHGAPPLAGFPSTRQGLDFLGAPALADVTGGGNISILTGGDSGALAAYTSSGSQAAGFPKFTGGWITYAPSTGDLLSNGSTEVVSGTREGYLFAWSTPGQAGANTQWWHYRHDEWNTGNYGLQTRPPGALLSPTWTASTQKVTFTAPGALWYQGTVNLYAVTVNPGGSVFDVTPSGAAGSTQTVSIPNGAASVTIQAINGPGLLSPVLTVNTPGDPPAPTTTTTSAPVTTTTQGPVPPTTAPPAPVPPPPPGPPQFPPAPPPAPSPPPPTGPPPDGRGYRLAAADGGIFSYGDDPFLGSAGALPLRAPIVGMASVPTSQGYWLVASDGGVFAFGSATFFGSTGGLTLAQPVVGMASTPDGHGYWMVASDGGVFAFGDALYLGSTGGQALSSPIVGMTPSPDGFGYWLVAADGGVFGFGDAAFFGSASGGLDGSPIVGIAPTHDGHGYWMASADGGVFGFGDAVFMGSMATAHLSSPVVSITATPDGHGYWMVASNGGVFFSGDAKFFGSPSNQRLTRPVVGIA